MFLRNFSLAAALLATALMLSCSSGGFESDIAAKNGKKVSCYAEAKDLCYNIGKELCAEIGGIENHPSCAPLSPPLSSSSSGESSSSAEPPISGGDYDSIPNFPEFTCKWEPEEVIHGDSAMLSLIADSEEPDCSARAFYQEEGDTAWLDLGDMISTEGFETGVLIVRGELTCREGGKEGFWHQNCEPLKINPVPAPELTPASKLTLNADYQGIYYYIGTVPLMDTMAIEIANKADARCIGDVEYTLTGSAAEPDSIVSAIATAECNGKIDTLARATATVVPNPELSDCELGSGAFAYMHSGEALNVNASLKNGYGRCDDEDIQYSLNGTAYGASPLSLSTSSGNLGNIKARAVCLGNNQPEAKSCPAVFVARDYKSARCNHNNSGLVNLDISQATTVIEYACRESKTDYWVACGNDAAFTFSVEGEATVASLYGGANLPPLAPILSLEDELYHYPKRILMTVTNGGSFSCVSW